VVESGEAENGVQRGLAMVACLAIELGHVTTVLLTVFSADHVHP
jgi:hypothetical protein